MNAQRRKRIAELRSKLEDVQAEVEGLAEEEREYYDNMPESFQSGEKGDVADRAASNLEEAVQYIQSALDELSEATDG